MTQEITTARLLIRPYRPGEAPELARLIGDWEVVRWLSVVPHPYTVEDAVAYITEFAGDWSFAITDGARLLGGIGISDGLGFWLGRDHWGRGYMSEAATAVVDAWFAAGNDELTSGYYLGNAASAAIHAKLGFEPGEVVPEPSLSQARALPLQRLRLTRADWQTRHG